MSQYIINGGKQLSGEVAIHGAKNSTLPILAATLLCNSKCVLYNCPRLSDVESAIHILEHLGCKVIREKDKIQVDATNAYESEIPDSLMREMRSSIVFLGAVLAKTGKALLSLPGGCELGPRPIDIHLNSLIKLGATIDERYGIINCVTPERMKGTSLNLPFPSVGATENIILAAVTAEGTTKIYNAAREPEIIDLADFLNDCGAKVYGSGDSIITIEGVDRLTGCTHTIIPDRIEATTLMAAAAATGSEILLTNVIPEHVEPVFYAFREAGCELLVTKDKIKIASPIVLHRIRLIRTLVYPGFPTDAQAPVMSMTATANGTSIFIETIFQNRYKHVGELLRLGANIKVEERVAVVEGVPHLYGADVMATDLRGGAALIVAALAAEGQSKISGIHHVNRGYEDIDIILQNLGADIKRSE